MKPVDHVAALRARVAAPNPDARLLAVCDRLAIVQDEIEQLGRRRPAGFAHRARELVNESDELVDELLKRPARTAAGRLAKGEAAARGLMGGAGWTNLARSALQDYRNAGLASEGSP